MKRTKIRFLVTILLLSLVACSLTRIAFSEEASGPFTPYEEQVVISIPYSYGADMIASLPKGDTSDDNYITRFYEEQLNIKYTAKWVVDTSQADEKLNVAIASDDIPDMFVVNTEMAGRLIKAGQVQEVGTVYDEYATDRVREICEYQDGRGFLPTLKDGVRYGVPQANDFADNAGMYWIRKDWLDKLGMGIPTTQDELLEIAIAFRDGDLDGNGKDDTIPIYFDMDYGVNQVGINLLANPFNAYAKIWVPDSDGGLMYSSIQPEMKEALGFMQMLYEDGLIDKEFAVKDSGKATEDVAAGRIGIYPGLFWSSLWPLQDSVDNNPDADWVACMIPENKDGKALVQNKMFSYKSYVVSAKFEHPEALIKSMNLWAEIFHGMYADEFNALLSTEEYKSIADGWHNLGLPAFFSHPEKNVFLSDNFIEMWEKQDPSLALTGEAANRWDLIQQGGAQGWAHKAFLLSGEQVAKQYDDFVFNEFVGVPTQTMVLRTAMLDKLEYEQFVAFIMGESLDGFDAFVEDWKAQGGDKITEEVNEWYNSVK